MLSRYAEHWEAETKRDNSNFYPFDDEGISKKKTVIVENGMLRSYLHDLNSASQFNYKSTGNGRAQIMLIAKE
jgi:predicted Zn-dependent protease